MIIGTVRNTCVLTKITIAQANLFFLIRIDNTGTIVFLTKPAARHAHGLRNTAYRPVPFFGTLCQFGLFQVRILKTALFRDIIGCVPFRCGSDDPQVQAIGNLVIGTDAQALFQTVTGQISMILRRIRIGMGFLRFPHDCFIFSFKHVTANAVIAEEADVAGFALFR